MRHHYSLGEGWALWVDGGVFLFVFSILPLSVCQHRCTSVLQVVLSDPLSRQLRQNVVQVIGVGVTVAGQVGAKFCLVVNLVPHNRVRLPRGAGCADGEDQAPVPRRYQQLQDLVAQRKMQFFYNTTKKKVSNPRDVLLQRAADLPALLVVWEVAVTREASRTELLAGVRVLVGLWEDADKRQRQQNANVKAPSVSIAA